jgi:hypothetical protein
LRFSVEPRAGYLMARLSGRDTAEEMRTFLRAVHQACRRHDCPRVLMSISASRAVFKPEDYGLSGERQGGRRGYASELATPACRIALVGDTPELNAAHEYIELVARQQGLDVRAFRSDDAAAGWFAAAPDPGRRYKFTRTVLQGAPQDAGIYALWDEDELIYYGRAASIRARLLEHSEQGPPASHYSWEICADPATREAELLREFQRMFGRLPRANVG